MILRIGVESLLWILLTLYVGYVVSTFEKKTNTITNKNKINHVVDKTIMMATVCILLLHLLYREIIIMRSKHSLLVSPSLSTDTASSSTTGIRAAKTTNDENNIHIEQKYDTIEKGHNSTVRTTTTITNTRSSISNNNSVNGQRNNMATNTKMNGTISITRQLWRHQQQQSYNSNYNLDQNDVSSNSYYNEGDRIGQSMSIVLIPALLLSFQLLLLSYCFRLVEDTSQINRISTNSWTSLLSATFFCYDYYALLLSIITFVVWEQTDNNNCNNDASFSFYNFYRNWMNNNNSNTTTTITNEIKYRKIGHRFIIAFIIPIIIGMILISVNTKTTSTTTTLMISFDSISFLLYIKKNCDCVIWLSVSIRICISIIPWCIYQRCMGHMYIIPICLCHRICYNNSNNIYFYNK